MRKLSFLFASLLTLSGCHSSGDSIQANPDAFVDSVNQFIKIFPDNILDCPRYYIDPQLLKKTGVFKVFSEEGFNDSCNSTMGKLLGHLKKNPLFSNVTLTDLKNKKTWVIYFDSKKRVQRLENPEDDFLK